MGLKKAVQSCCLCVAASSTDLQMHLVLGLRPLLVGQQDQKQDVLDTEQRRAGTILVTSWSILHSIWPRMPSESNSGFVTVAF